MTGSERAPPRRPSAPHSTVTPDRYSSRSVVSANLPAGRLFADEIALAAQMPAIAMKCGQSENAERRKEIARHRILAIATKPDLPQKTPKEMMTDRCSACCMVIERRGNFSIDGGTPPRPWTESFLLPSPRSTDAEGGRPIGSRRPPGSFILKASTATILDQTAFSWRPCQAFRCRSRVRVPAAEDEDQGCVLEECSRIFCGSPRGSALQPSTSSNRCRR